MATSRTCANAAAPSIWPHSANATRTPPRAAGPMPPLSTGTAEPVVVLIPMEKLVDSGSKIVDLKITFVPFVVREVGFAGGRAWASQGYGSS
jgi:hypothetical protein